LVPRIVKKAWHFQSRCGTVPGTFQGSFASSILYEFVFSIAMLKKILLGICLAISGTTIWANVTIYY